MEYTQVCGGQGFTRTHASKPCKNKKWCQLLATLSANAFTARQIFFGGFDRPHGCLKLYHSLSVWHSGLL